MTLVAHRRARTTTAGAAATAATAASVARAAARVVTAGAPVAAPVPAPTEHGVVPGTVAPAVAVSPAGGPWHRLLRALGRVTVAESHPCMYAGCTAVVGPGEGWRHGWLVFCSDECGAADQDDAVL
ncbi:hypothetical protein [Cellulomonas sp. ATA003]|uniref:hypothetical protein n=1 Tax=Cellulomonas sp. ATA003 TaxID=3073064 RepID=UPI002873CCA4|nr:hypothetical protein [Cellulomonas sp. ATA003]WNB84505.1 hypothetical protein REH70_11720 [Cellulomonas sp. ATA003]